MVILAIVYYFLYVIARDPFDTLGINPATEASSHE